MNGSVQKWRHIFKLDPDRTMDDESLERLCLSGTDGIMIGGSTGVTYDNTAKLLERIRRYAVPCVSEPSNLEAVVPGFDAYMIPIVLNATETKWIVGQQQIAIREYGSLLSWDDVWAEGYIILNSDSTAAKVTGAQSQLDSADVLAYARLADHLFRLPIVYLEYSGRFGDMALVRQVKETLSGAQLFYGGGIDSVERAIEAMNAADTIVVGNLIYDQLDMALQTVKAKIEQRNEC